MDDLLDLIEMRAFQTCSRQNDGSVKPIFVVAVDGGPDDNPRFPKTIAAAKDLFRRLNLDCLFMATEAPGNSAYNYVERRMAPLSRELTGIIIPHDTFGTHLSGGTTICKCNLFCDCQFAIVL